MMSGILRKGGWAIILGLVGIGAISSVAYAVGVPEPGVTLYGQVLAGDGSLVTNGRLLWTFTGGDAASWRADVAVDLFPIAGPSGTTFSYSLVIPAETPVGAAPVSDNRLPVTANPVAYHREATLDGAFTWIVSDATSMTFGMTERGKVERVDLQIGVGSPPDAPSCPLPANGEVLVPLDVTLNWADCSRAESYDVYLWQGAYTMRPSVPTISGLTASLYQPSLPLQQDRDYLWQVVARNLKGSTAGPRWVFRTGFQTDLQKLLDYLLGKRQLTFQEQSLFDLNADRNLDVADLVVGLKRTVYQGSSAESTPKPLASSGQRTISVGSEWVDPDTTISVQLPLDVSPGCDGVTGINFHVEADPLVVTFLGARPRYANNGEDLYYYCPRAGVINVVFFTNPVTPLRVTGTTVLLLDLRVNLPREYECSPIHLMAAAMSDTSGLSILDIMRSDGSIQTRGGATLSRNWQLYR